MAMIHNTLNKGKIQNNILHKRIEYIICKNVVTKIQKILCDIWMRMIHTLFILYPAWNIIGGSNTLKNNSGSNVAYKIEKHILTHNISIYHITANRVNDEFK